MKISPSGLLLNPSGSLYQTPEGNVLRLPFGVYVPPGEEENSLPIIYGEPITITSGGTYTFNAESLSSSQPVVTLATSERVTLYGCNLRGPGLILSKGSGTPNLVVLNSRIKGTVPTANNTRPGRAYHGTGAKNVEIYNCEIEGTTGLLFQNFGGNGTYYGPMDSRNQTIRIKHNRVRNLSGLWRNWQDSTSHRNFFSQFVQFISSFAANIEIAENEVINRFGESSVEDVINIYQSGGVQGSPMVIRDNLLWGSWRDKQYIDDVGSAAGITTDGSNTTDPAKQSRYVKAFGNVIMAMMNAGMNIPQGNNIDYHDNTLFYSGYNHLGQLRNTAFSGFSIFNRFSLPDSLFHSNTMRNQHVGWYRSSSSIPSGYTDRRDYSPTAYQHWYSGTTHFANRALTYQDEVNFHTAWLSLMQSRGVTLGVPLPVA